MTKTGTAHKLLPMVQSSLEGYAASVNDIGSATALMSYATNGYLAARTDEAASALKAVLAPGAKSSVWYPFLRAVRAGGFVPAPHMFEVRMAA